MNDSLPLEYAKKVGSCEVCGRRAELGKVQGYEFKMCPHCAYMTKSNRIYRYKDSGWPETGANWR